MMSKPVRDDVLLTLGARPKRDGSGTHFKVWVPRSGDAARHVHVVPYRGANPAKPIPLGEASLGYFEEFIPKLRPGDRYLYQLDNDEGKRFADPASRYQPDGVKGPSEIVEHRDFLWT